MYHKRATTVVFSQNINMHNNIHSSVMNRIRGKEGGDGGRQDRCWVGYTVNQICNN